jgi:hypothetical protein
MNLFCKHDWHLILDKTTESKYEHSLKIVRANHAVGSCNLPWQLCDAERMHIVILTCKKCGKLKRYVTEI